jgi:adenosylmethionine-8-amino-7-oxononanoate aminotransferase
MNPVGFTRPVLVRGRDCHVWDREGRRYLDATSGAFCVNLGYTRPDLVEAMARAAEQLPFARSSLCDSEAAEAYRDALLAATGPPFTRVVLTGSGSEAVDAAVKLAISYQRATGHLERTAVRSLAGHYHGATLGALRVTGWETRRAPYEKALGARDDGLPSPGDGSAAFIAESIPVAGRGVEVPPPGEMARRRAACDAARALWIADEVLTGFGRCGALFAWQRLAARADSAGARPDEGAIPDLVAFGKGAGAGYAPLAGELLSRRVADALDAAAGSGGARGAGSGAGAGGGGGFTHYQTYGGNPIACSVGLATLRALKADGWLDGVGPLEDELRAIGAGDSARVYGALLGFESKASPAAFAGRGVFVHAADGARRVVAPPLCMKPEDWAELRESLAGALAEAR